MDIFLVRQRIFQNPKRIINLAMMLLLKIWLAIHHRRLHLDTCMNIFLHRKRTFQTQNDFQFDYEATPSPVTHSHMLGYFISSERTC
jgi:hypothetical protein